MFAFSVDQENQVLLKERRDRSFFFSDAGMRPSDHDTNQGRKSCAIEHHLEMGWKFIWLDLLDPIFSQAK